MPLERLDRGIKRVFEEYRKLGCIVYMPNPLLDVIPHMLYPFLR